MYKKGLVSILIPCYNHEKFVEDCLESIMSQTYTNYEVIICDDASKDRSVEKIKSFAERFLSKGIRFELMVNEVNQGITRNLNNLLKHAKGQFVKSFASDDMMKEDYLENILHLMEDEHIKMAYSNCFLVQEESTWDNVKNGELQLFWQGIPYDGDVSIDNVYLNNLLPAPTFLLRREVFDELGGYDEEIGIEDLDMTLRIMKRYPSGIAGTEEGLIYYRKSANSVSSGEYNAGALKRMKFMHRESVKIARKFRADVSKSAYRQRMRALQIGYLLQRIHIFMKR